MIGSGGFSSGGTAQRGKQHTTQRDHEMPLSFARHLRLRTAAGPFLELDCRTGSIDVVSTCLLLWKGKISF
eukprot:5149148-Prymnesium_polylepis.1